MLSNPFQGKKHLDGAMRQEVYKLRESGCETCETCETMTESEGDFEEVPQLPQVPQGVEVEN